MLRGQISATRPTRTIVFDAVPCIVSGGITYSACLVNAMATLAPRWQFHVYASSHEFIDRLDRRGNVHPHKVPGPGTTASRLLWRELVLPLQAAWHRADGVVAQFPGLFLCTVPQVMIANNSHYVMDPPVARTCAKAFELRLRRFMFCVGHRLVSKTVYSTNQMASLARRWTGPAPGRSAVIYQGVNPQLLRYLERASPPPVPQEPYFVAVGTVWPHKNYETTIRGFALFLRDWPHPMRLKIAGHFAGLEAFRAGAGPKPDLIALTERLGVADRVDWLTGLPNEQLYSLLRGAVAFVCTSVLEAFTLTVIEAMAAGLPVLVPSTTSFPEVVGSAGLYHDPSCEGDVAKSLRRVAEDPELCARLGRLSRQKVKRYSWDRTAENYLVQLEGCIGRRERQSRNWRTGTRRPVPNKAPGSFDQRAE